MLKRVRRLSRRSLAIGVVGALALAGGGVAYAASRSGSSAGTTYQLVTAGVSTIRQAVSATGTIEPAESEALSFAVSGKVTSVKVAVGGQVTNGQALATVSSATLAAQVAQANAGVASAEARLSSDQNSGASSAQLAADEASITTANNQLTDAQSSLSDATLRSPITGVVAAVDLVVGQQVSGSGSSNSANSAGSSNTSSAATSASSSSSAQVTVISKNTYIVSATVDDTEIGQIKADEQAVITPSSSTTPVYGTVSSVGMIATSTSGVASYPVTIKVTGHPSGLHAGSNASVSIIVKQLTDVLTVPVGAVHVTNGKSYVTVVAGGKATERAVTTGASSGGQLQITSGLTAGQQVRVRVTQARPMNGGTTSNQNRGGFGGGGLGGGGLGGGGLGGGGPRGGGGVAP